MKRKASRKKTKSGSIRPAQQVELDKWLDEITRKNDDVLRCLANPDAEMLTRVRPNIERYRPTLEQLGDT